MPPSEPIGALPRLESADLSARWMTENDLDDLLTVWGDPEVMRFMARPPLADRDEARDFLGGIRSGFETKTLYQWGLVLPDHDRVVGTCTLAGLDWHNRRCEIGFALAKAYWRRGLARKGVSLVLEHAFRDLELHRIEADVDPENAGSLRLLERLGFRREGLMRQRYLEQGEFQDSVFLGLLRHEWRPSGNAENS